MYKSLQVDPLPNCRVVVLCMRKGIPKWHLEERSKQPEAVHVVKLFKLSCYADALSAPKCGIMI